MGEAAETIEPAAPLALVPKDHVVFPIPEPIMFDVLDASGKPAQITAADYVEFMYMTNSRLRSGLTNIFACGAVAKALKGEPGTFCQPIHVEDLRTVVDVMIKPENGYPRMPVTSTRIVDGKQHVVHDEIHPPLNEAMRMLRAFVGALPKKDQN